MKYVDLQINRYSIISILPQTNVNSVKHEHCNCFFLKSKLVHLIKNIFRQSDYDSNFASYNITFVH